MSYVYAHIRKDNNKCFYIGIGKGERAHFAKRDYNPHWTRIAKKHGYEVKILVNGISIDKAKELERDFISQVGIENLTNILPGGEGGFTKEMSAKSKTPEALAKLSKSRSQPVLQFTLDGTFIKEWPSQIEARKEVGEGVWSACTGRQHTAQGYKWAYKKDRHFE